MSVRRSSLTKSCFSFVFSSDAERADPDGPARSVAGRQADPRDADVHFAVLRLLPHHQQRVQGVLPEVRQQDA